MNYSVYKLTFKKKWQEIVLTSCWHIGNPQCREDKIKRLMESCARTETPFVMLGDIIESIGPFDKRYHAETHKESVTKQMRRAAEILAIGKKMLIGLHVGNHEDALSRLVGSVTNDVLERAKTPLEKDFGGAHSTDLICPSGTCKMFSAHSSITVGGGTSDPDRDMVNRHIRLRRLLSYWQADLKVIGHGHRAVIAPPVSRDLLYSDAQRETMKATVIKPEWCVMAPSMFASYSRGHYPSYAEIKLYPPTDIGWCVATIGCDGKVVNVEERLIR